MKRFVVGLGKAAAYGAAFSLGQWYVIRLVRNKEGLDKIAQKRAYQKKVDKYLKEHPELFQNMKAENN